MLSAFLPALSSCADKAIEKQPACAAAINSSGLVPIPSSKRVLNEYWVLERTPLSVEMLPLPSLSPPVQTADAFRFMFPPDGIFDLYASKLPQEPGKPKGAVPGYGARAL